MFRELQTLIRTRPLTLTVVSLGTDKIRVCVIPQALEADSKINDKAEGHKEVAKIPDTAIAALTRALCLEGTPDQLDTEMAEKLTKYSESHCVLRDALDRAQEEIAQAVQAIEDRNKAKMKSKQSATPGKDGNASGSKSPKGKESETNAETHPSDTLPLEWLAPPATPSNTDSNGTKPTSGQEVTAQ